ncbi:DUF805 domain-containing protein [Dellaglioa sp. BT-FLS60]
MFLIKTYINFFKHYFDFRGRSTRIEYWIPWCINGCIDLLLSLGTYNSKYAFKKLEALVLPQKISGSVVHSYGLLLITLIFYLIIIIPAFSILFRRLNDAGVQKRWYGLIIFVKLVCTIFRGMISQTIFIVIFMILSLIQFYLLIKPSKNLSNI